MNNNNMGTFIKGAGTGLVVGMAVATIVKQAQKNNKGLKKNANKTMGMVSDFLDNLQFMIK